VSNELVKTSAASRPVIVATAPPPELVEPAGWAASFASDEFFNTERAPQPKHAEGL
jgi:hypothetical protein